MTAMFDSGAAKVDLWRNSQDDQSFVTAQSNVEPSAERYFGETLRADAFGVSPFELGMTQTTSMRLYESRIASLQARSFAVVKQMSSSKPSSSSTTTTSTAFCSVVGSRDRLSVRAVASCCWKPTGGDHMWRWRVSPAVVACHTRVVRPAW